MSGTADFLAARARLYGATPHDLWREINTASVRTANLAASIRPDEPGAADRAERFSEHCDALRRQALLLRQRLRLLTTGAPPDAA
jgi:hypothetical protein